MKPLMVLFVSLTMLALPAAVRAERHTVRIEDLKVRPATITINVGDTIEWVNNDDRDHIISADDGSFRSGRLGSGKTFRHTFNQTGRFPYGDDRFARLRGIVIVNKKGK